MRKRTAAALVATLALAGVSAPATAHEGETTLGPARAAVDEPQTARQGGTFSDPFSEPTIAGQLNDARCIEDKNGITVCKPTAGSVTVLQSGKVLYWNALEGTERVQASIVAEYGAVALNDQTRTLDLRGRTPRWGYPKPNDAGANPDGYETEPIVPGGNGETNNDGALFCSDLTFLPDGRVLAAGGTAYYHDPEIGDSGFGISELEGLRNARIYDPRTNTWSQTGSMNVGRWYPSLVTLPDGDIFVASGVQKLLKPVYPSHPQDSGTNVLQTETYDTQSGKWTDNGTAGRKSLPLYPRLHLLPNGRVFYNAAGQSFNPVGQSYDEATWNVASTYDPKTKSWRDLGIPGLDALPDSLPGFRGSTFSVMLPLKPPYTAASFLTAGGVLHPPSPGSYFSTNDSRITTVETKGATETMTTEATGDFQQPRWYPSGILLPTGEVMAFSGSDRDHVAAPGLEFPVKQAELFDPESKTWKPMASGHQPRTYHNSAALLPDGRVLIGGHAPINTLYLRHQSLPGPFAPNEGRDPSFEIYSPPYLFRGDRPEIERVAGIRRGRTATVAVDGSARDVRSVVLLRNNSNTHVIDPDQRSVELRVVARKGSRLVVEVPASRAVLPAGPYLLFVNERTSKGLVPSKGEQVMLG